MNSSSVDHIGQINKYLGLGLFIHLWARDLLVLCRRQCNRSMLHLCFTFISTVVWTCIHCSLCGLINLIMVQHALRGRKDCVERVITLTEGFAVTLHTSLNHCSPSPLSHPYHIYSCTNKYPSLPSKNTHIPARVMSSLIYELQFPTWQLVTFPRF